MLGCRLCIRGGGSREDNANARQFCTVMHGLAWWRRLFGARRGAARWCWRFFSRYWRESSDPPRRWIEEFPNHPTSTLYGISLRSLHKVSRYIFSLSVTYRPYYKPLHTEVYKFSSSKSILVDRNGSYFEPMA